MLSAKSLLTSLLMSRCPSELASVLFQTRSLSTDKKFYKTVFVERLQDTPDKAPGGFQLLLNKYAIKTPGKHLLVLPTHALALAVAAEWEWQDKGKPQMHSMPLMSLAATALDQPKPRDKVVETLLKYIHTDTTCCRVDGGKLALRQAQTHDPLLAWAHTALGWQMATDASIYGPTQIDGTVTAARTWLEGLDHWNLAVVEQLTQTCKSLVIAAALSHGHISIRDAVRASRLEEDVQMEEWGAVEAGHDLDIVDVYSRVAAPSLFLRLLEVGAITRSPERLFPQS